MSEHYLQQTKQAVEARLNEQFGELARSLVVSLAYLEEFGEANCVSVKGDACFFAMALKAYESEVASTPDFQRAKALRHAWPFREALRAGLEETEVGLEVDSHAYFRRCSADSLYAVAAQNETAEGFPVQVLYQDRVETLLKSPEVLATLHEQGVRPSNFLEFVKGEAIQTISRVIARAMSPGCPQSLKD